MLSYFGFVPECDRYCGKRGSIMFHFGPNSSEIILNICNWYMKRIALVGNIRHHVIHDTIHL